MLVISSSVLICYKYQTSGFNVIHLSWDQHHTVSNTEDYYHCVSQLFHISKNMLLNTSELNFEDLMITAESTMDFCHKDASFNNSELQGSSPFCASTPLRGFSDASDISLTESDISLVSQQVTENVTSTATECDLQLTSFLSFTQSTTSSWESSGLDDDSSLHHSSPKEILLPAPIKMKRFKRSSASRCLFPSSHQEDSLCLGINFLDSDSSSLEPSAISTSDLTQAPRKTNRFKSHSRIQTSASRCLFSSSQDTIPVDKDLDSSTSEEILIQSMTSSTSTHLPQAPQKITKFSSHSHAKKSSPRQLFPDSMQECNMTPIMSWRLQKHLISNSGCRRLF